MNIIFLDIDGVLNSEETFKDKETIFHIDPKMAGLLQKILKETGAKVVLSSSWRCHDEGQQAVKKWIDFIDVTPDMPLRGGAEQMERGKEIQAWLDTQSIKSNFFVEKYCILDDDSDMLPHQKHFKTSWKTGLTEEIANKVIKFFNPQGGNKREEL